MRRSLLCGKISVLSAQTNEIYFGQRKRKNSLDKNAEHSCWNNEQRIANIVPFWNVFVWRPFGRPHSNIPPTTWRRQTVGKTRTNLAAGNTPTRHALQQLNDWTDLSSLSRVFRVLGHVHRDKFAQNKWHRQLTFPSTKHVLIRTVPLNGYSFTYLYTRKQEKSDYTKHVINVTKISYNIVLLYTDDLHQSIKVL